MVYELFMFEKAYPFCQEHKDGMEQESQIGKPAQVISN